MNIVVVVIVVLLLLVAAGYGIWSDAPPYAARWTLLLLTLLHLALLYALGVLR